MTSDVADVVYRSPPTTTQSWSAASAYDDPEVGIEWPARGLKVSARDAGAPSLREIAEELPFRHP